MNLLHICCKKDWGGGENQLLLTLDLIAKETNQFQQFLLCPADSIICRKVLDSKIYCRVIISSKKLNLDPRFIYSIYRSVKENNIDLIHVHDPEAHTLVVLAIDFFRLNTNIVLHKKTTFPIKKKKYSVYKYNHKNIKHIICVSEASKKSIEQKINSIPISVVYDAVNVNTDFTKAKKSDVFTILNVANHTRHKNLFTLLDIANECINVRKLPFRFIQIGHGKLTDELTAKHTELCLEKYFEFKGFVTEVDKYYEYSDIFLFTSVREGLGVSLLEAIKYRLPIVSSNSGGISEVLTNQVEGLTCDYDDVKCYADNLEMIYNSKELASELTENAFIKLVKNFSSENMIKKLIPIYLSI